MSELKKKESQFLGNPYDLETIFESLSIASKENKELLFMDRLVYKIQHDQTADITYTSHTILTELNLLQTLQKHK